MTHPARRPEAVAAIMSGEERRGNSDGLRDLDLLTPDDVCALLKVKKSWLYDEVEGGRLDAVPLGRQLRFRPSDLALYLDTRAEAARNARRG